MNQINLDKTAAKCAQLMVKEALKLKNSKYEKESVKKPAETLERLVTKALGVLQSQGVYALMLFLFSRTGDEKKVATHAVHLALCEALEDLIYFIKKGLPKTEKMDKVLTYYSENICSDLDRLLLVRQLYEQILIYTRYHAKAIND